MSPVPQAEFSYAFRRVLLQFQHFLGTPENRDIVVEDAGDLASVFTEIPTMSGNVNTLLQHHAELRVRAGWFHAKYSGFLAEASRNCTTTYNLLYTERRERGYGEWDAKRFAETKSEYLALAIRRDRLQVVVNILKVLLDACGERLAALQQISNNYRAEVRELALN